MFETFFIDKFFSRNIHLIDTYSELQKKYKYNCDKKQKTRIFRFNKQRNIKNDRNKNAKINVRQQKLNRQAQQNNLIFYREWLNCCAIFRLQLTLIKASDDWKKNKTTVRERNGNSMAKFIIKMNNWKKGVCVIKISKKQNKIKQKANNLNCNEPAKASHRGTIE